MKRSTERILTTHTGSLPRPADLAEVEELRDQREVRNDPRYRARVPDAVRETVQLQANAGIDVLNDGEVSKVGYSTYITERVTGFDGELHSLLQNPSPETLQFPGFYSGQTTARLIRLPACNGQIRWVGDELVRTDIENLKAATQGVPHEDVFMSAASPGVFWFFYPNEYYKTDEEYVFAAADAMKHEYQAIVDAGFTLQLDAPDLAMGWNRPFFIDKTEEDFRKMVAMHVEALNHATVGIPEDRMRMHVCWGNGASPHTRDIPLTRVVDLLLHARPAGLSLVAANARHEYEWRVWEERKLPEEKVLIPGVVDSLSNVVEHPQTIAQRLERFAGLVGKENVIAGSDCGFGTIARSVNTIHPEVTWAKLKAMADGARLASDTLWGRTTTTLAGAR